MTVAILNQGTLNGGARWIIFVVDVTLVAVETNEAGVACARTLRRHRPIHCGCPAEAIVGDGARTFGARRVVNVPGGARTAEFSGEARRADALATRRNCARNKHGLDTVAVLGRAAENWRARRVVFVVGGAQAARGESGERRAYEGALIALGARERRCARLALEPSEVAAALAVAALNQRPGDTRGVRVVAIMGGCTERFGARWEAVVVGGALFAIITGIADVASAEARS